MESSGRKKALLSSPPAEGGATAAEDAEASPPRRTRRATLRVAPWRPEGPIRKLLSCGSRTSERTSVRNDVARGQAWVGFRDHTQRGMGSQREFRGAGDESHGGRVKARPPLDLHTMTKRGRRRRSKVALVCAGGGVTGAL